MNRKRTWSIVGVAATGIVGIGAALGVSAANASERPAALHLANASRPVVRVVDNDDARKKAELARKREQAELAARKAKVVKAVLAKFPHARILRVVLHRDGVWVVTLQLRDHRVGFVTVDKHLRVSPFHRLVKRDADDAMRHVTTIVVITNTPFNASQPQHW